MFSFWLLSGLLLSKGDVSYEMSIRLTAVCSAVLCVFGLLILLMYNEKKILAGITDEVISAEVE